MCSILKRINNELNTNGINAESIHRIEYIHGIQFYYRNIRNTHGPLMYLNLLRQKKRIDNQYYFLSSKKVYFLCSEDMSTCCNCKEPVVFYKEDSEHYHVDGINRIFCQICNDANNRSYIYTIYCLETNLLKIGIANNVRSRFANFVNGMGITIKLFHLFETDKDSVAQLEKNAHQIAHKQRVIGEWFRPSLETIDAVIMLQQKTKDVTYEHNLRNINNFCYRKSRQHGLRRPP